MAALKAQFHCMGCTSVSMSVKMDKTSNIFHNRQIDLSSNIQRTILEANFNPLHAELGWKGWQQIVLQEELLCFQQCLSSCEVIQKHLRC